MSDTPQVPAADWEAMWAGLTDADVDAEIAAELSSLRFRYQREMVQRHIGPFAGLDVIEVGAGRATNALAWAVNGAHATVLDRSPTALEQSRARFAGRGLDVATVLSDVFDPPSELRDRFDVSMSFGLCEHFTGERRREVIEAHLQLVRPGGLALVNVPNRLSPLYRAWMGLAKRRGTWTLGHEEPFSGRELIRLARRSGGRPLRPRYVGGLGTLVNHGANTVLTRLGRRPLPVPQIAVPGLDYLAYDLLIGIIRPGGGAGG